MLQDPKMNSIATCVTHNSQSQLSSNGVTGLELSVSDIKHLYNSCVKKTKKLCAELRKLNPQLYGSVYPFSHESCMFYIPINDKYQLTVCIMQNDSIDTITIDTLYKFEAFLQQPGYSEKLSESIKGIYVSAKIIHSVYAYWKKLLSIDTVEATH